VPTDSGEPPCARVLVVTRPATIDSLVSDLRGLGVRPGDVLMVHASMSAVGFVVGGAQAIGDALLQAVGPEGTVAMPAQSADWSEPSVWEQPPVPEDWWPVIREQWPAFDPYVTPLRGMGAVADAFLLRRDTLRSNHPRLSVMAHGAAAPRITEGHTLEEGFGEGSPLARLYELDAKVLLIGVGHGTNTSLHLAECRAAWPGKRRTVQGSAILTEQGRRWVTYEETHAYDIDFADVGNAFSSTGAELLGTVGAAPTRIMGQRALVDFAAAWFTENRYQASC